MGIDGGGVLTRVVGSGESKGRSGLESLLGAGVRQRESSNNNR